MLCPKCGRPLVENAPYCVHCGALFEGIGTGEAGEIDLQPDELIIMKGKNYCWLFDSAYCNSTCGHFSCSILSANSAQRYGRIHLLFL